MTLQADGKLDKPVFGVHYDTPENKFDYECDNPDNPFNEDDDDDDDDDDDGKLFKLFPDTYVVIVRDGQPFTNGFFFF